MAVTNLVKDQSNDHAKRIAEFAADAIIAANETYIDTENPERGCLSIRVGFHSGPVGKGYYFHFEAALASIPRQSLQCAHLISPVFL